MKTDAEIRWNGTRALLDALGEVDAERYISLLLRDPFDYTAWQRSLLSDYSVRTLSEAARKAREETSTPP